MIEALPGSISIVFVITTFLTIGFLFYSFRQSAAKSTAAKILVAAVSFWIFFTASASFSGFYTDTSATPPRVFIFGALPALLLIFAFFLFFRKSFIEILPLKILTMLSIIRIPVEIVIFWLFQNGLMPQIMTFEGQNIDILSGITAPIVVWVAFRKGKLNRPLLIVWNFAALILLINIVTTAVLAIPSPFQQIAFDQPNRAVFYFPFIWLPSIVVPIVLFAHLASLWKLIVCKSES